MSGIVQDLSGSIQSDEHQDISGNIPAEDLPISTEEQEVSSTWGLRLRTRMDELANRQIVAAPQLHLNEIYIQSMVYLLRFLGASAEVLQFVWLLLSNVGHGVKRTFKEDVYVFFKDCSYPYSINDIKLNCSGVPDIEWYYNATTNTFLTARLFNSSESYHTQHIPYLAAEVKYNDLTLYDVSEFINGVRWAGNEDEAMPNISQLISAWSINSKIVLKRSEQMNLCVINTDGNETRIPLRNEA